MTFTSWYYDPTSGMQQPDGLENEKCSIIQLFSIHNMNDWHDVACAYDKISNFICEIGQDFPIQDDIRNTWSHVPAQQADALYMCESGEYILNAFLCDSVIDCISGDDERNCSSIDTGDQFTCDDGDRISISLYCDFILHCKDGSDENSCERRVCSPDEWQCTNRQCITNQQRCDFVENCFDKSDETECETCSIESFQCYDQQCIPSTRACDGMIDCSGLFHEDESEDCLQNRQHTCKDWWASGEKRNGEYLIDLYLNESALVECIFQESKDQIHVTTVVHHDNEETITDIMEDFNITPKYFASDAHIVKLKQMEKCQQAIEVKCHFSQNMIYRSSLDGREIHNKQNQGNCGCPFVGNCQSHVNKCNCGNEPYDWYSADDNEIRSDIGVLKNNKDLPVKRIRTEWTASVDSFVKVHLGPLKCEEDVAIVSTVYLCSRGQSVPSNVLCVLDYDVKGELIGCRDLSHLSSCERFLCPPGYFKCQNSYCIPPKLFCNGIQDCPLGEDEFNCSKPLCSGLFRCHSSNLCLNPDKRCDGFADCPQFDDELLCHTECARTCKCHGLSRKCIFENISEISFLSEIRKIDLSLSNLSSTSLKLKDNILLAELNVSRTELNNLERLEFGESHNLFLLDISFNQLTAIPKNIFRGLTHLKSLLLLGNHFLENIYPQSFSGLRSLPIISLRESHLHLLTENTFIGLTNLKSLNLTDNKIKMVEDRSFASLGKLKILDIRRNKIVTFQKSIFEGLTNLKEIYSDAFVFCCLRPDSVKEEDCLPTSDEFSSCSDMMRNDILRTCLWIIGVCGLFGNLIVLGYRICYDRQSLSKSYGIFITSLGTSDCLMGIYMLTIASADVMFRGNYVWNDLSWRYGVSCKIAGILSTVSSESSVVFLFLITIDRFIAVKYPFGEIRFGKKSAIRLSVVVFLTSFILAVVPLFPGSYFDGNFYSRSAVCLALPLTRDKPNGWEYSFGIFIVLNFILFLIIAVTQLVIYKEVTNPIHIRSTKKNQDLTIARKLFLVVFSDFLCWFPVGVMGLMALRGHSIPAEVYSWTAVFILPINSALNPFLYTFASIRGNRRLQQKRAYQTGSTNSKRSNASWGNVQGKNEGGYDETTNDDGMVDKIVLMVDKLLHENKIKEDDVQYIISKLTNTIDNNCITGKKVEHSM
ncbi:G-protein coupled receptor GRL101-like [Mytilus californianus]|uniref:G-protein coupled receptor GRL101-like n=1 Tax=Mytilus californianus TaxID=6549 RepID=UPI002245A222|nr:G-protein coupled receptor GRL101-like [Mytilus californianus]